MLRLTIQGPLVAPVSRMLSALIKETTMLKPEILLRYKPALPPTQLKCLLFCAAVLMTSLSAEGLPGVRPRTVLSEGWFIKQIDLSKIDVAEPTEAANKPNSGGTVPVWRVQWPGGNLPPQWFYDECDRRGVLVWQDFYHGYGMAPVHEPRIISNIEEEVQDMVNRLRNHPCIVVWTGGNENHMGWEFQEGYESPLSR